MSTSKATKAKTTNRKQKRVIGDLEGKAKAKTAEAKSTKTPHRKVASAQRPNRSGTGKSVQGDRKWIYRGVTKIDGRSLRVEDTSEVDSTAFPKEQAEQILNKALERDDIVAGRLFNKKSDGNTQMRGVWVAFAKENGVRAAA